jgi:hypothetical protein
VVFPAAFLFALVVFLVLAVGRAGDFLAVDRLADFLAVFLTALVAFFTAFLVADVVFFLDPAFEALAERAGLAFFVVRLLVVFLDWVVRLATLLGPRHPNNHKFLFHNKKRYLNSHASIWFTCPDVKI